MPLNLIKIAEDSFKDEVETSAIYAKLSSLIRDPELSRKLRDMALMEGSHARFWTEFLRRRGIDVKNLMPKTIIVRMKVLVLRLLGLGLTFKLLEMGEREAIKTYSRMLDSSLLNEDEKEGLKRLLEDELVHEEEFMAEESKFKDFIDHVRDAVLGMNDGLVEILSVSAGLAGAYGDPLYVALGGAIVGISGSLSMGIGTYISVKAQREVRVGLLERIKLSAKYVSHLLSSRVANYMQRKGFSDKLSNQIGEESSEKPELLSKVIGEEEYGLKEESLENPKVAGLYTGLFYILGAFIPLTPYFLKLAIPVSLPTSFILAGIMLGVSGFFIALTAGISIKRKAMELVVAGLGSAVITYLIGLIASLILGINVG